MFADIEVWAIPLNSALLIILALTNAYIARSQRREQRDMVDVKRFMGLTKRKYDPKPPDEITHRVPDTGRRRRATDNHK